MSSSTNENSGSSRVLPKALPSSCRPAGVAILWYRNDLRIRDNEALAFANNTDFLLPTFVFDERHYGFEHLSPHGFQRTGPFRAQFLRQAVLDVRSLLRKAGSDLLIRVGRPHKVLVEVVVQLLDDGRAPVRLVAQKEVTHEETEVERDVEDALRALSARRNIDIEVVWVWGSTLHHHEDLPFDPSSKALPDQFTTYCKWIESETGPKVRPECATPKIRAPFPKIATAEECLPSLLLDLGVERSRIASYESLKVDERAGMLFVGGPTAGDARLKQYIWDLSLLGAYKATRDFSGSRDTSTKLSPWLALGCVSPRTVYWEAIRYERETSQPGVAYWLIFHLLVRDYYRWAASAVSTRLFAHGGFRGWWRGDVVRWRSPAASDTDEENLKNWVRGRTGSPFVDAVMRELAHTGYVSNRGRQIAASFLINNLSYPDWRAGAEYFEYALIDHDVASNWANWATMANVGSVRRVYRLDVERQAKRYDPDGVYIARWCPEAICDEAVDESSKTDSQLSK